MTPREFQAWMTRTGLSKADVHRLTGIARTTIDRYLAGTYKIPLVVELACQALEAEVDAHRDL